MRFRGSILFLLVWACAACGRSVDMAAEEEAIRALSAHWLSLDRQGDAEGIAALFAEDATLLWEDRPFTSGRAAVHDFLAEAFAEGPTGDGSWAPDHIDVAASGDIAVERGRYENPVAQGRYTTLYRKIDGEWRVQADMSVTAGPDGGAPEWATAALATWYERYNARNAQGIADLYTPTAVVGDARGRAAIIRRFQRQWAEDNDTCAGGHDEFMVVGSLAVGLGRDVCTRPGPNGATTTTRFQWIAVHERQPDGRWLLVRDLGEELRG